MKFYKYVAILKHDKGKIKLKTFARNKEAAINIFMRAESCPRSAIILITRLYKSKGKTK